MSTSIRVIEQDFELTEKVQPVKINLDNYELGKIDEHKGILKLTLSIGYFLALVYFLFKLMV